MLYCPLSDSHEVKPNLTNFKFFNISRLGRQINISPVSRTHLMIPSEVVSIQKHGYARHSSDALQNVFIFLLVRCARISILTILVVFLETSTGVPPRSIKLTYGTSTSALGIRATTLGTSISGSGLCGLSDEQFNYFPIQPLRGCRESLANPILRNFRYLTDSS